MVPTDESWGHNGLSNRVLTTILAFQNMACKEFGPRGSGFALSLKGAVLVKAVQVKSVRVGGKPMQEDRRKNEMDLNLIK